jgi:heme-degrading monooxygenase HmoA
MYSAAFIFKPRTYDDEFHRLNKLIDEVAKGTEGFLGAESWFSNDRDTVNAIYYWESLESLKEFSRHPTHLEAKRQYSRWYDGYHIVISEIVKSYGDGTIDHFTPNQRDREKS